MRTLILSCNTGAGHNSCARAIGTELQRRGHAYETDDALLYVSKGTSRFVSNWHVRFYRYFPKLYNKGYQYAEEHPASFDESSAACRILRRGCKRLRAAIVQGGYDAVVCVHLFPALMLTFIQRQQPLPVRTMFIATDYTASPSCDRMQLDTCVIPDASLRAEFEKNGVRPETILPCGIPVREELYTCLPNRDAKLAVGLEPSHRHLVMMTGSMGCGPMERITELLANSLPPEYDVTVACSSNRQLLRRMERRFADKPNIHICGFISNVSVLMDSADLFLTKPGGISTTEAMVKGLPMVLVNVVGSRQVADMAVEYGAEKMIMVSTDKAVNPTNVMGCSKRLAEIYVQSLSYAIKEGKVKGCTKFITTRFGNVLGSNGSVIPRFKEQIENGGPVTVTHPDIIRYFMTIPEACRLVMEAATMGEGYEIFVFEMGKPVKIVDLAVRMIELAGYKPNEDIEIQFTGLRPGEKLYEEVLSDEENTIPTHHKKIKIAKVRRYEYGNIVETYDEFERLSRSVQIWNTVKLMKWIVPEFKSKNSRFEELDN